MFQQDNWLDLEANELGFYKLNSATVERICKLLPTQRDRYEACLIHRSWQPGATSALWQDPEFRHPDSFKLFLAAVTSSKRSALAVRRLSLCVRDADSLTAFQPVLKSKVERHTQQDIFLSNPKLILHMARQCEKLQSLRIYGWRIEPQLLEQLAGILPELQEIVLIGANDAFRDERRFRLSAVLPKLKKLCFDGDFLINPRLAMTISNRCQNLRSLQMSLKGMAKEALDRLCLSDLHLEQLTLTDAAPMHDSHVAQVLESFKGLREFCLHGTINVTSNVISNALSRCPRLTKLEIRADVNSLSSRQRPTRSSTWRHQYTPLRVLLLENLILPDNVLMKVASLCPDLVIFGLLNCSQATDVGVGEICRLANHLRELYLIGCSKVGQATLEDIMDCRMREAIRQIHIENCGELDPPTIYKLCCACADHNLRLVRLVGYESLQDTIIGKFADRNTSTLNQITIDQQNIDALANIDAHAEPELMMLPKNRYLTGEHIVLLSKELGIDLRTLENILDKVQSDSQDGLYDEDDGFEIRDEDIEGDDEHEEDDEFYRPEQAPAAEKSHAQYIQKQAHSKANFRPTTPALWAHTNDSAIEDIIPRSATDTPGARSAASIYTTKHHRPTPSPVATAAAQQSPASMDFSGFSPQSPALRSTGSKHSTSTQHREPTPPPPPLSPKQMEPEPAPGQDFDLRISDDMFVADEWPSLSCDKQTSSTSEKQPEVSALGGWGMSNTASWPKKAASGSNAQIVSAKPSASAAWVPDTMENHEFEWQQQALDVNVASLYKKKRFARDIVTLQTDGWGTPKSYIPWDDMRKQGFAHEVLEQQKQTAFWDVESGEYKIMSEMQTRDHSAPAPPPPSQKVAHILNEEAWPAITSNRIQTSPAKAAQPQSTPSPRAQARSMTNAEVPPSPLPKNEVLSSDNESIDLDEDDGVFIKTSPSQQPPQPPKGKHPPSSWSSSPSATTSRPSSYSSPPIHPGKPAWLCVEDWIKHNHRSNTRRPLELAPPLGAEVEEDEEGWGDAPVRASPGSKGAAAASNDATEGWLNFAMNDSKATAARDQQLRDQYINAMKQQQQRSPAASVQSPLSAATAANEQEVSVPWTGDAAATQHQQQRTDESMGLLVDANSDDVVKAEDMHDKSGSKSEVVQYDSALWQTMSSLNVEPTTPAAATSSTVTDAFVHKQQEQKKPPLIATAKGGQPLFATGWDRAEKHSIPGTSDNDRPLLDTSWNDVENNKTASLDDAEAPPRWDSSLEPASRLQQAEQQYHVLVNEQDDLEALLTGNPSSTASQAPPSPQSIAVESNNNKDNVPSSATPALAAAATTTTVSEQPSKPEEGWGKVVCKMEIELSQNEGPKVLVLYENRNVEETVAEYCEKYNVTNLYQDILKAARGTYEQLYAKRIARRKKKRAKESKTDDALLF